MEHRFDENEKCYLHNDVYYPICNLKIGDNIRGSTLPYSAKYIDETKIYEGTIISSNNNSIYDIKIQLDNGTIVQAVNRWIRASCIIEKLD